jgi:hypothetical protein
LIENTDILHIILDSISDTDLPVLQSVSSILNYTEKTVYEMKNALDQTLLLEVILILFANQSDVFIPL